ncbi:MAG TPA: DUF4365 domain-containing protein [Solirubrobacteraceae bacterium]
MLIVNEVLHGRHRIIFTVGAACNQAIGSACSRRTVDLVSQRPEAHQLEDESRRAFEGALPRAWVVRRIDPDYGLDSEVELFTDDGERTGMFFKVQLKATNEERLDKALQIRFPRDTANYYRSLPVPVLVVRYHASTGALYARWFHAYNPHVALGGIADTKTIRFQFYPEDEMVQDTPEVIEAGLRAFLKFRSPELQLPLPLAVTGDPEAGEGRLDVYDAAFALRRVLEPVSDLVVVERRDAAPDDPAVFVGAQRSVVALGDVASVTADHASADKLDLDVFAADAALALSMVLSFVGQANLAAQIGAAVAERSSVIVNVDVALTLAETMHRAQRVREAVELANRLDESDDGERRFAGQFFLTASLAQGAALSADESAATVATAKQRFDRCEARGDSRGAAAAAYSLGMVYKQIRDASGAVKWFEAAARIDSTYEVRSYYHRDFAGVLFESGDPARSATHYGRAIELGERDLILALHADALLFSGRYGRALGRLDEYLSVDRGLAGAEWRLKRAILPLLIEVAGADQDRELDAAIDLAERVDLEGESDMSLDGAFDVLSSALKLDACCSEAWGRLALLTLSVTGQPSEAHDMAVACAALARSNPAAWGNAVLLSDPTDDERLLDLFSCGYRLAGPDFAVEVAAQVRDAPQLAEHADKLVELLEEAVAEADERERTRGFTLRFPAGDGEVHELVFSRDPIERRTRPRSAVTARRPASFTTPRRKRPPKTHGKTKKRKKRR